MTRATHSDKNLVVEILTNSFVDNLSVNYIIKQDNKKRLRIKRLMEYSFDVCYSFGDIFLTNDKKGCALLVYPDKKKTTLQSILLDVKLAFTGTGLGNVSKAMKREAAIKAVHPKEPMYYLWFIGVDTAHQGKGIGSELLQYVVNKSKAMGRTLCLETSTTKNLPWYSKFGFSTYRELDFGYKLYCMKLE